MKNNNYLNRKLDQLLDDPDNFQYLNEIGVFLYQMKDFKNAELYLERAYKLCFSDKDILMNYALLLCHRFKIQKAMEIFQAYLIDTYDLEVIEKLIALFYQLEDYEKAIEYINMYKKGAPI